MNNITGEVTLEQLLALNLDEVQYYLNTLQHLDNSSLECICFIRVTPLTVDIISQCPIEVYCTQVVGCFFFKMLVGYSMPFRQSS